MKLLLKILFFIFAVSVATVAEAHSSPAVNVQATSFSIFNFPFSIKSGGLIRDFTYSSNGWVENKLRYNGKELLSEFDLGWYDYGSRYYNPMLGMFTTVDPQATSLYGHFPYAYGLNNPMLYIDPDGELPFLAIVGIGAAIGAITGGIRGAIAPDMTFWDGLWQGGLVGAIGGALSPLGGGSFMSSALWGMGEGAITGGVDAALWGNNIGDGMLWGAAAGAVFGTLSSENFKNFTKGKGFYSNETVFENFKAGKYAIAEGSTWQQEALNYFGFKGTYDPSSKMLDQVGGAAATHPKTGEIVYGDFPFDSNFDRLSFTANHEMQHSKHILSGQVKGYDLEEWTTYMHNYRNQGLYPNHGFDLISRIQSYGFRAGVYPMVFKPTGPVFTEFKSSWYHLIYKLPRRW